MAKPKVSVVIPAYNEAFSIGNVIDKCKQFCDEIIVVDDGSIDNTSEIARDRGAIVIAHEENMGVTRATENGLKAVHGDIVVTIDADEQHNPSDIPKLIKPVIEGKADVTLGVRDYIPHRSERIINWLTNLRVKCSDAGTGFRAMRVDLAKQMRLHGTCLCGTFVLESHRMQARMLQIPIEMKLRTYGERRAKTRHIKQFFYVLKDIIF